MTFGSVIVAVAGYGTALVFLLAAVSALRDIVRASRSPTKLAPDGTSVKKNTSLFLTGVFFSIVLAALSSILIRGLEY